MKSQRNRTCDHYATNMSLISSGQDLFYRLATPSDAPHLTALINAAFRSERTGQTWLFDDQDKRIDIVSVKDIEPLIDGPDTVMLTASISNESLPVACCFLRRPSETPQKHTTAGAAWLGFLTVLPNHHHRGYGHALLCEAESYVRRTWNATYLELDAVNARTQLRAWYNRCGYHETGASRDFFYGEKGREILADGLEMVVLCKDLGGGDRHVASDENRIEVSS